MTKRTFGGTSRKRKRVSGLEWECVLILVEELLKAEGKKGEKE